jgi:hypothetical protein
MNELEIEVEQIGDGGIVRVKSSISTQQLNLQQALSIPVRVVQKTHD